MDALFIGFAAAVFVTVALLTLGIFMWWNATRGGRARRLAARLQSVSEQVPGFTQSSPLLKKARLSDQSSLQRMLATIGMVQALDRLLQQADVKLSVTRFCAISAACAFVGWLSLVFLNLPQLLTLPGLLAAGLPLLLVIGKRRKRLNRIQEQLPDALDLMNRAMRAGHAFPSALRMAGEELAEPIARELRNVSDEVNYGIALPDALNHLSARVPGTDVSHFVVAVLIQRETGGNLAELLSGIASIVRERIKLFGQVRVLSAEGRFSAWILAALPVVVAGVLQLTNRQFINVLWTDPAGRTLLYGMLILMAVGGLWMRQMVRIRV